VAAIPDLGQGTKAYIGSHVQDAAAVDALNGTEDVDALVVVAAIDLVEVEEGEEGDYADVEYSFHTVPSHGYPEKYPTRNS
jgi:hypothetical protein